MNAVKKINSALQLLQISFLLYSSFYVGNANGVVVIPLGYDCKGAIALRDMNLRKAAYPFDWIRSPFASLYAALNDDFQFFLNPESLRIDPDHQGRVLDGYGFQFVHDFPSGQDELPALDDAFGNHGHHIRDNWQEFIPVIREKYLRRIERFRNVLAGTEPVVLTRCAMSKREALKIRDLLVAQYPNLDFTLVVINNHKEKSWHLDKIKNFYIKDSQKKIWQATCKQIYKKLGITKESVRSVCDEDSDTDACDGTCIHCF